MIDWAEFLTEGAALTAAFGGGYYVHWLKSYTKPVDPHPAIRELEAVVNTEVLQQNARIRRAQLMRAKRKQEHPNNTNPPAKVFSLRRGRPRRSRF